MWPCEISWEKSLANPQPMDVYNWVETRRYPTPMALAENKLLLAEYERQLLLNLILNRFTTCTVLYSLDLFLKIVLTRLSHYHDTL